MSKRLWSDHRKTKSLIKGWRRFLNEEEAPPEDVKDTVQIMKNLGFEGETAGKNFIIMVGGPGTGKGGMIGTDRFMGSIIKATKGKMAAKDFIKSLPPGTINQFDSEVDAVLRLMQWDLAAQDYQKLSTAAENPDQWKQIVNQYASKPQGDINLIKTIAGALGGTPEELATPNGAASFLKAFPDMDAYAGKKDETSRKALKKMGGNNAITATYMQLRSGWGEDPGKKTIKNLAVQKYNDELKGQLEKFIARGEQVKTEAVAGGDSAAQAQKVAAAGDVDGKLSKAAKDVFILDSAGEDLPSQDYEGQLRIAKGMGFNTTIIWIKTGPEISYLGNLERAVVGGKRAVPPQEIEDFYSAAAGEGDKGVGPGNESADVYFNSLLKTPADPNDPNAGPLLDDLIIVMNKDGKPTPPKEIEDIASHVCTNPLKDPDAEPKDHVYNRLCDAATIKRITKYDIGDLPSPDPAESIANFGELEKAIMDDFEEVLKGEEIPKVIAKAGAQKEKILNADKAELKAMAKSLADHIQGTFEDEVRQMVRDGKGGEFTTKAYKSPMKEGRTLSRWKLLAGIK